eukprot:13642041-Alexandrium_andersonii.AAC.1
MVAPTAEPLAPINGIHRCGATPGQRSFACIFVIDKTYADTVLMPASGEQGVTFQKASFGSGEDQAAEMA